MNRHVEKSIIYDVFVDYLQQDTTESKNHKDHINDLSREVDAVMNKGHFMVILNNLQINSDILQPQKIAKLLFEKQLWLFSPHTAKVKSLRAGDYMVVYLAGKGNRIFIGKFRLGSKPKPFNHISPELKELAGYYSLVVPISDIVLWNEPKPIIDLLPKLSFIVDKKNYGLYLRQGLRQIPQQDFEAIITATINR